MVHAMTPTDRTRPHRARVARQLLAALLGLAALAPASAVAYSEHSVGTAEQIAWVRRAANNFVTDELARNGAGACGILNAPLRASRNHVSCEARWSAKLARMLHEPGERAHLRSEQRAIAHATVVVRGNTATIDLPAPLDAGPNRFLWTENCWMLEG
jgi:hypothetical protein